MPDRHQSPAIDNQDCEAPNIAAGQSFAQVPNLAQTGAELTAGSQKAIVNKALFLAAFASAIFRQGDRHQQFLAGHHPTIIDGGNNDRIGQYPCFSRCPHQPTERSVHATGQFHP